MNSVHSGSYQQFLKLVQKRTIAERQTVNRRMLGVFVWCFLMPAVMIVATLILIRYEILPRTARNYLDWMILVFPVIYSVFILIGQVIRGIPSLFRVGGVAQTLIEAAENEKWRESFLSDSVAQLGKTRETWRYIAISFECDLERMLARIRYLTGLAGAVLFLIMQGIDSIAEVPPPPTSGQQFVLDWFIQSSTSATQFIGLSLFLLLLYLSGSQTYHSLKRYLDCARLMDRAGE